MQMAAERERTAGIPLPQWDAAGHKNMHQLIQLRWIAIAGQIITIAVVTLGFGVALPLPTMVQTLAVLIAFNIGSHLRWQEIPQVADRELFIALLVDVAVLTVQLYLSGGTTNPFASLYLLQVILGAMLLKARWTWMLVAITTLCFAALAVLSQPLRLPLDHDLGLSSHYVQGMMLCFVLNATLLVVSITRINRNVRERDKYLAQLRQSAAEHDHIVRLGLLASGAAHELGTPLATLDVILGDWQYMPELQGNAELRNEMVEMQAQVRRCKRIVSDILQSAGEPRGESSAKTTVADFLNHIVTDWRNSRAVAAFDYTLRGDVELAIVGDSTIQQMICNVLDNALEASPLWFAMEAECVDGQLTITVTDHGPGFPPQMLAQLGRPYQSSKGRPGSGLGLYLSVNVARTLGGSLTAQNRAEGGASVQVSLPLLPLTIAPHASP
ncbi:ATP-binding protein [Rhodoferax sp. GW822-FHT02A01]|uniref:ATP-binding protein n=1 Tax=Rhodoferax sp. GW822-FHT02A01 TaxID=3141537 RepID=UPI00315D1E32